MTTTGQTHRHRVHQPQPEATPRAAAKKASYLRQVDPAHPPQGMNPAFAQKVRKLDFAHHWLKQGKTTFCNQAFNAYAHTFGYSGFDTKGGPMIANLMYKKMSAPGSGWHKVDAQGAIDAAKAGKLAVAAYYNDSFARGRPDGHKPGHVAAVTGEWAPGVPGVSQAGSRNFEFGRWQHPHAATFFVYG